MLVAFVTEIADFRVEVASVVECVDNEEDRDEVDDVEFKEERLMVVGALRVNRSLVEVIDATFEEIVLESEDVDDALLDIELEVELENEPEVELNAESDGELEADIVLLLLMDGSVIDELAGSGEGSGDERTTCEL